MSLFKVAQSGLCAAGLAVGLALSSQPACADSTLDDAKAAVSAATGPQTKWEGPTSGPAAPAGKRIVYISCGGFNEICVTTGKAVTEAAGKLGWKVTTIDGKGSASGWLSAWNQALALNPDGVIAFTSADAVQAPIQTAKEKGIPVVGVLSAATPGPNPDLGLFTNVSQDPASIGKAEAQYAIAKENGAARVVIVYDKLYAIARYKADAMKAEIEKCANCKLLDFVSTPAAQIQQNAGQLISSWVTKYGPEPFWIVTVGDVFADFLASPLRSGGVDASKVKIIGADGMSAAYGRIRTGDYQVATIPQPITQLGYQAVDEMVRALQKQPASGYAPHVYIVEGGNVNLYGGDKNQFIPDNNFAQEYEKIWMKK
jgi:ribose transport system substrate-binding protein